MPYRLFIGPAWTQCHPQTYTWLKCSVQSLAGDWPGVMHDGRDSPGNCNKQIPLAVVTDRVKRRPVLVVYLTNLSCLLDIPAGTGRAVHPCSRYTDGPVPKAEHPIISP